MQYAVDLVRQNFVEPAYDTGRFIMRSNFWLWSRLSNTWDGLSLGTKCIWIWFITQTVALITLVEVVLLK